MRLTSRKSEWEQGWPALRLRAGPNNLATKAICKCGEWTRNRYSDWVVAQVERDEEVT